MSRQVNQFFRLFLFFSTLAFALAATRLVDPVSLKELLYSAARDISSWNITSSNHTTICRSFPGDDDWPTKSEWDEFNSTVGGKLIATVPLASVCHEDSFETYDADKCATLQTNWVIPETHWSTSSSIMAPYFANQSCDPFYPKSAQCVLGTYIRYAVNVSDASDIQKTVAFTKQKNVRLVIRNTGHDYLGKSTGAGALGIWTHNMKDMEIQDYSSTGYTGKAIKAGAGIQVDEAYDFVDKEGLVIVGGNCPTVGLAGGFSQGGGHSPVGSQFGLAADQVLEWEVVTAGGDFVTATPYNNHSDLYWALSGGGGGTYGVVVSMTSKAHEDFSVTGFNLTLTSTGISSDLFYGAVESWISNLPNLLANGIWVSTYIMPDALQVVPLTAPRLSKEKLLDLLSTPLNYLNKHNITYDSFIGEFPSFLTNYNAMNAPTDVAEYQLGGRLLPKSLVESNIKGLMSAIRNITEAGSFVSAVSLNVSQTPSAPNSVNPAWREAVIDAVVGTNWNNTDWASNIANQPLLTDYLLPQLEALTPGGGSYLNEADFQQPNWQQVFYGENYERLVAIKAKYDPDHVFYALKAAGSEVWTEQDDGRLCLT